jgi:hypothetical protein
MYQERVQNLQELMECIMNAEAQVTPNMLEISWQETQYQLDIG